MKEQTTDDFSMGDLVRYVPYHAYGDCRHPDCEDGTVTSKNQIYVFVRFAGKNFAQACAPDQLVHVPPSNPV